jgi:phage shock protein C
MFCPHCGNETNSQLIRCNHCGATGVSSAEPVARIVRPRHPRMIAGVCSGIAIHYGWDVAIVRILMTVAVCLTTGAALLFYLAGWLLIPEAPYALPPATRGAGDYSSSTPA